MFFNRLNSLKSNSARPGVCAGSVALLFCCNYQLSFWRYIELKLLIHPLSRTQHCSTRLP